MSPPASARWNRAGIRSPHQARKMEMAPNKVDQGSRAPVMRNGMGWAREGRAHSGPIRKLIKKQ
jgi:hypothetical protein